MGARVPAAWRTGTLMAITGGAYFAAALVGAGLSSEHVFATLWPPNGVLIAVLLRSDTRLWPYLLFATCPANAAFDVLNGRSLI